MHKLFSEHKKAYIVLVTFSVFLVFILTSIVINSLLSCADSNGCIKSWCTDSLLKPLYLKALKKQADLTCRSNNLTSLYQNYTRIGYPY